MWPRVALLDELFKRPVVRIRAVEQMLGVSQPTASALVMDLVDLQIVVERTGKQRYRVFGYQEYLNLFPGATLRN